MESCRRDILVLYRLAVVTAMLLPAPVFAQGESLAACPAPAADTVGWTRAYTPDSSVMWSMPPHFALEGGRWRAADGRWFGVSVIDLFEGRRNVMRAFGADAFAVDSGPPPHIFLFEDLIDANWLPEGSAAIGVGDAYVVRKHSACREALDGVPALIEAGLITGGFATVRDVPAVQVTLRPSWATLVVAGGQASDLAGQRELLAIARTIRARWR